MAYYKIVTGTGCWRNIVFIPFEKAPLKRGFFYNNAFQAVFTASNRVVYMEYQAETYKPDTVEEESSRNQERDVKKLMEWIKELEAQD